MLILTVIRAINLVLSHLIDDHNSAPKNGLVT